MKAAISLLENWLKQIGNTEWWMFSEEERRDEFKTSIKQAIRVLESWPKWERLIEAAGKVDKNAAIEIFTWLCKLVDDEWGKDKVTEGEAGLRRNIRALLEALPGSGSIIDRIRTLDPFNGDAADNAIDRLENDLLEGELPEEEK